MTNSCALGPYIFPSEHIFCSGSPEQGLLLHGRDALLIPFSLMWGGFAIVWNAMVWSWPFGQHGVESPDIIFKLWGLPFLMAGLYLIIGRFFHDAYIRRHILYAVTDQRIMILSRGKMTSVELERLPRLELTQHRDGTGTLSFEATPLFHRGGWQGFSWWTHSLDPAAKFIRIPDAPGVYRIIRGRPHAVA